jgi:hypothetical protein
MMPPKEQHQLEVLEKAIMGAVLSDEDRETLRHLRPHAQRLARIAQIASALGFLGDAFKWAAGIAAAGVVIWRAFWGDV